MDPLASINPYVSLKDGSQLGHVYEKLPAKSARFLRYKGTEQPSGSSESIIIFDFEIHDVATIKSQYSALSYTWGHPVLDNFKDDLSHTVICNGQRMPIGLNLHDALQHIYVESDIAPPLFWVDAVCINQSDLAERSAQVALMTSIYFNAANVVVWLGKDDEDAREAYSLLSEYTPALKQIALDPFSATADGGIRAGAINLYDDAELHERYSITARSMDSWTALVKFFSRRWFGRIWIVQEMVFNQSHLICCGPLRFDWRDLDLFVSLVFGAQWHGLSFRGLERETLRIAYVFTFHREIRLAGTEYLDNDPHLGRLSPEQQLYEVAQGYLISSATLEATDPRDRVYAVTAFVNSFAARVQIKPIWLRADYSLQTAEVMLRTAQLLLWKTRSLKMLSYVSDLSCRAESDLPSWMPHFHIPGAVAAVESLLDMHQGAKYHASSLSTTVPTLADVYLHMDSAGQELEALAFQLDTVERVIHFDDGLLPLLEVCLELPLEYANGQPPVEVLWRTLIAGRTDTSFPAPAETASEFATFVKSGLIGIALPALAAGDRELLTKLIVLLGDIAARCPHPAVPTPEAFSEILSAVMADLEGCLRMLTGLYATLTYRTMISPTHAGQKGKALVRTEKGYLGLAPYSTMSGDEVWLLKGANLFHVLRGAESGSAEASKVLLGEAYVHGFMEGEALRLDGMTYGPVTIK
ncbi:HET-domain-containing protein [Hypomontagnella submonticulosa]|nr:HET-domain-containing protein [Hypomontagnella submonticulosa]